MPNNQSNDIVKLITVIQIPTKIAKQIPYMLSASTIIDDAKPFVDIVFVEMNTVENALSFRTMSTIIELMHKNLQFNVVIYKDNIDPINIIYTFNEDTVPVKQKRYGLVDDTKTPIGEIDLIDPELQMVWLMSHYEDGVSYNNVQVISVYTNIYTHKSYAILKEDIADDNDPFVDFNILDLHANISETLSNQFNGVYAVTDKPFKPTPESALYGALQANPELVYALRPEYLLDFAIKNGRTFNDDLTK